MGARTGGVVLVVVQQAVRHPQGAQHDLPCVQHLLGSYTTGGADIVSLHFKATSAGRMPLCRFRCLITDAICTNFMRSSGHVSTPLISSFQAQRLTFTDTVV